MATWRYIKGSEKDFEGAPEWCDRVIQYGNYSPRFADATKRQGKYGIITLSKPGAHKIIAQRERVTSVNDDRLASDTGVNALITERGNRYGKFADGAEIIQQLKDVMHKTEGWSRLTNSQREALGMIQHKIGRILNGDPTYDDNWKDIAGYATLVAEELNGVKK